MLQLDTRFLFVFSDHKTLVLLISSVICGSIIRTRTASSREFRTNSEPKFGSDTRMESGWNCEPWSNVWRFKKLSFFAFEKSFVSGDFVSCCAKDVNYFNLFFEVFALCFRKATLVDLFTFERSWFELTRYLTSKSAVKQLVLWLSQICWYDSIPGNDVFLISFFP